MLPVILFFVGPPINHTGGRFTTRIGSYASILSFVNRTTVRLSTPYFTNSQCSSEDTSIDAYSTSSFLHDSVDFLYLNSILRSHIILSERYYIKNWYWNNLACHLCTRWVTLASGLKNFCSPLQLYSIVNSDPHKYFSNFPIYHLTVADSPTKLCLKLSRVDIVDLEMKQIGRRHIPYRDFSNSQFLQYFSCASNFLVSPESYACKRLPPFHHCTSMSLCRTFYMGLFFLK